MTYYVYETTIDHPVLGRITYIGSHCFRKGSAFQFDYSYHGSSTFTFHGETFLQMVERYPHRCVPISYAFSDYGVKAQEMYTILNRSIALGWFEDGGRLINKKSSLGYLREQVVRSLDCPQSASQETI